MQLSGSDPSRVKFINCDLCNEEDVENVFKTSPR